MYSKGQNKPHKKRTYPFTQINQTQIQISTKTNHLPYFQVSKKKNVLTLAQYDPKRHYLTVYPGLNFRGKCPK